MKTESTNHQDVAEPDQVVSGTAGTGQKNEELEWARRHLPEEPLRQQPGRETSKKGGGAAEGEIRFGPEIPDIRIETAMQNLIRSLKELDNHRNEEILFKIEDLGYRIGELEKSREKSRQQGRS